MQYREGIKEFPTWTRSCAACCRWPCFGRGVGQDDPQRSLPTLNILWFCEFAINELAWLPKSVQSLMETSAWADQLYLICISIQSMPVGEFKKNSVLQYKLPLPRVYLYPEHRLLAWTSK